MTEYTDKVCLVDSRFLYNKPHQIEAIVRFYTYQGCLLKSRCVYKTTLEVVPCQ
jgi:hypothetical protein